VYVLVPKEPLNSLPKKMEGKVANQVYITGRVFSVGGSRF
jgi:hypothetical protein